jgi:hypothetical protein
METKPGRLNPGPAYRVYVMVAEQADKMASPTLKSCENATITSK